MSDDDVLLERDGSVAWLILNRPEKRNALTFGMWQRIPTLLEEFEQDPGLRILIVRGAGNKAFSAGADISEFETLRASSEDTQVYNAAAGKAQDMLGALSKPTIAMIQGACVGGGCGVALSCDLRVCDESAKLAITPARLGLVYPVSVTKRLVDLVGPAQAKRILFTGAQVTPERALAIGLVDDLVDGATFESQIAKLAETISSRAQYSIRSTKRIIELITQGLAQESEETLALRNGAFDTADYREGVRAFMEKRPANFTDAGAVGPQG